MDFTSHRRQPRLLPAATALLAAIFLAAPQSSAGPLGAAGDMYVASQSNNKLLQFDGATGAFSATFASGAPLSSPFGLVWGPNGNLFVSNVGGSDILEYDGNTGAFVRTFASGNGLTNPFNAVFGPNGNLYTTSANSGTVIEFQGTTGAFVRTFVGNGVGGSGRPSGLTFGPNGNLFVSKDGPTNNVIECHGTTGALLGVFASGSGLGNPRDVMFRADGTLLVANESGNNVLQFNSSGGYMTVFAAGNGQSTTFGMDYGPNGNLFVASRGTSIVIQYNGTTGAFINTFSTGGDMQSPFGLRFKPIAIIDCNSNAVADEDDIAGVTSDDCDSDGIPDECQIAVGSPAPGGPFYCTTACDPDCNDNGIPDGCESDCNGNNVPDDCDLAGSTSTDCNTNNISDDCDIAGPTAEDCNANAIPDACDFANSTSGDCDSNAIPDECEGPAGPVTWIGSDGGVFSNPANWNPAGVPGGGSFVTLSNSGASDNRCILDSTGTTGVCSLQLDGTGSGRQILTIEAGSILRSIDATSIDTGGEIELHGGELAGATVTNASNTLSGYGRVSASVINQGVVRAVPDIDDNLVLSGASLDNQAGATLQAGLGALIVVRSDSVQQSGSIETRPLSGVTFTTSLTNSAGGLISLIGGAIGAADVTNESGALIEGTGTVDADVLNGGDITLIADTLLTGNLQNDGTVTIQSGQLTVRGNLTGTGSIIGGFGGRDGGSGLVLHGDLDWSALNPDAAAMAGLTIQMVGDDSGRVSSLEVFSADRGPAPAAVGAMLARLHIGPHLAGVRLADNHDNARSRRAAEALYVRELVIEPGSVLDVAGKRLYCERLVLPEAAGAGASPSIIDSIGGGGVVEMRRAPRRAR